MEQEFQLLPEQVEQ